VRRQANALTMHCWVPVRWRSQHDIGVLGIDGRHHGEIQQHEEETGTAASGRHTQTRGNYREETDGTAELGYYKPDAPMQKARWLSLSGLWGQFCGVSE